MPPDEPSDRSRDSLPTSFEDWLSASRRGSAEDLGRLLESSRAYLLAVAHLELGSTIRPKAGVSDLVQESLLEAHCGFDGFCGSTREEFLAWTATILRRNLADLARRYRSGRTRSVVREEQPSLFETISDAARPPPDQVVRDEELDQLDRALARLPEEAREVIRLRHEDQLGWDEIGRRVGKSAEAARKIWFRSVERLRSELDENDDGRG